MNALPSLSTYNPRIDEMVLIKFYTGKRERQFNV
jgi:hypothetical protein